MTFDTRFFFFNNLDPPSTSSIPFQKQLANVTRYSTFRDLATIFYGDLPVTSGSSIVSSIEFDKDGDFFAVGGVTRKIKVFKSLLVWKDDCSELIIFSVRYTNIVWCLMKTLNSTLFIIQSWKFRVKLN